MKKNKIILATTYAVHPTKGSEDAMGWNYILQIARYNSVICITRENNQSAIDKHISKKPSPIFDRITFIYYDLPAWKRFWKKGSRGAMLYYWLWQRGIPAFVRKKKLTFDIVHNVTFPNDWTPSYLWKLNKPFVWGPIGHHPLIPQQYLKNYSRLWWLKDRFTWIIKNYFWKFSPGLNKTIKKSDFIYAMNSSVNQKIRLISGKHFVRPSVATQDFGYNIKNNDTFHIISCGRFVPLKGFDLTIDAFAKFLEKIPKNARTHIKLTLIGKGPEEKLLKKLILKNKLTNHVEIINWIERFELIKKMQNSDLFLFPSHEGAGMVVAEALSCGLPVICLDNCGSGEFITPQCGVKISPQSYENTIIELAEAIHTLYQDPQLHNSMKIAARNHFEQVFHWDKRGEWLNEIYQSL